MGRSGGCQLALIGLLILLVAGCAAFRDDKLPEVSGWPPAPLTPKKTISVSIKGISTINGKQVPNDPALFEKWKAESIRAYAASGLFTSVVATGDPSSDLRVEVIIQQKNEYNQILAFITGFSFGLAALIIPQKSSDDFLVRSTFKDQGGKELTSIEKSGSMSTWTQMFLLFAMPFRDGPEATMEKIIFDLNRSTIVDARAKGIY